MAIAYSKRPLPLVGIAGLALCFLSPQALAAGSDYWSYGPDSAQAPRNSVGGASSINPWTGEGNGPRATSPDQQFQYGEEQRTIQPPPSLEDLYPKPGTRSRRPWGEVPHQFQQPDSESSPWYGEERARQQPHFQQQTRSQQTRQWPERAVGRSPLYGDEWQASSFQGGGSRWPERFDHPPPYRGYGDPYGSPPGPLFNEWGIGNGGWPGPAPQWGGSDFYQNGTPYPGY
ncbi:MAG: hypothetical protein HQL72_10030 [Magnetococcales bacterium]|nr:hypothetical protein [Magnetococcales bacterium]